MSVETGTEEGAREGKQEWRDKKTEERKGRKNEKEPFLSKKGGREENIKVIPEKESKKMIGKVRKEGEREDLRKER